MNNKHIYEGWTVADFINDLLITWPFAKEQLKTRDDVKKWCMNEQPYYKKYIPEVVNHFCKLKGI